MSKTGDAAIDERNAVPKSALPSGVVLVIELKEIAVAEQARRIFDKEAHRQLVESVKRHGVLEPLLVRRLEKGGYQLIAGERRLRAAKEAGLLEIKVNMLKVDEHQAREIQAAENLQREDLTPIEAARAYGYLFRRLFGEKLEHKGEKVLPSKDYENAVEQVARQVGKPPSHVKRALRLLELPAQVQAWIEGGELRVEHGLLLLTVPASMWPEVQKHLAASIKSKDQGARWSSMGAHDETISVASLERYLDEKIAKDLRNAPFPTSQPFAGEVACTACPYNTKCQTSLLPGLEEQPGTCRQPSCWTKKREFTYKLIREKKQQLPEFKDLSFVGYARVSAWDHKLPEQIRGFQVVGGPLAQTIRVALKDPLKREAVGWAIVKPAKDSRQPEVKTVYVIKDPKAFAGTKGISKEKPAGKAEQSENPENRKTKAFGEEVSRALHQQLVRKAIRDNAVPKPLVDALDLILGRGVDSDADFKSAFDLLGIRAERKVEDTLRVLKLERAVYACLIAESLIWWWGASNWKTAFGTELVKDAKIPQEAVTAAYEKFKGQITDNSYSASVPKTVATQAALFLLAWKPGVAVKPEAPAKTPVKK